MKERIDNKSTENLNVKNLLIEIEEYQKSFEYKAKTIAELIVNIDDYLKEHDAHVKVDYYYTPKDKTSLTRYQCDLAVLSPEDELLRAYEVCSLSAFERNLNTIQMEMKIMQERTGVEVFLAYKDKKDELAVLSMSQIDTLLKKKKLSQTKTVNSFLDFYKLIKRECGNRGPDQQYFFRGQPDMQYPPLPSIYRKGRIEKENYLYHEAIRRNPAEFSENMSTFDNLVKMQHYELPTRLLDITKNPLVALFFACQKDPEADGEVLVYSMLMDSQIKYFDSDSVCILANLAKRPIDFDYNKEKYYLIYDIKKDSPIFDGDKMESYAIHNVYCVLPKLNNQRIVKQDGAFFIFGMGDVKKEPAKIKDSPITIIIKAEAKKEILKELDLLGINEASLFPETDKVMHQIKEEFCMDN